MIPKHIIKLALENGSYIPGMHPEYHIFTDGITYKFMDWPWMSMQPWSRKRHEEMLSDPLFWQALGKGLGQTQRQEEEIRKGEEATGYHIIQERWWKIKAFRYFELVLTGGDLDKFWEELIKE